jgi:catechol 2,3-dioxygenase-like lactoylglutathione lyase family enzyme
MISIQDLFEVHFSVTDLDRSIAFYRDAVGLRLAHVESERGAAFFRIGVGGSILGLWATGSGPHRITLHAAFRVSPSDVVAAPRVLRAAGITPLNSTAGPRTSPPSWRGCRLRPCFFVIQMATSWNTSLCFPMTRGQNGESYRGECGNTCTARNPKLSTAPARERLADFAEDSFVDVSLSRIEPATQKLARDVHSFAGRVVKNQQTCRCVSRVARVAIGSAPGVVIGESIGLPRNCRRNGDGSRGCSPAPSVC